MLGSVIFRQMILPGPIERKFHWIWFKRDLRVQDHEPLNQAANRGPCIGIFVIEDEWLKRPEFETSHYDFVRGALIDLQRSLASLHIPLVVVRGAIPEVFLELKKHYPPHTLYSHEETGLDWTYQRDREVQRWCRDQGIEWREYRQTGVIRGLKNRTNWQERRDRWISQPVLRAPIHSITARSIPLAPIPTYLELGLPRSELRSVPSATRTSAEFALDSFLKTRSPDYLKHISSPLLSVQSSSRLSPYLSWGLISAREIHHQIQNRLRGLDPDSRLDQIHIRSLQAFESRLAWRCHFIQKLESEPEIEWRNVNRGFDGLRENDFDEERFETWCRGETGFPMVDACMRALRQNGWINFRMRAMLVSFAAYQLWLHWERPARFLARYFLDFEPGIHWYQFQMQSGVTGTRTIRIYSPEKQQRDWDPEGKFVLKYCPELRALDLADLARPDLTPPLLAVSRGFQIGRNYPAPIVNPQAAYDQAKIRIFQRLSSDAVQQENVRVLARHSTHQNQALLSCAHSTG